jgi:hypothetical protein
MSTWIYKANRLFFVAGLGDLPMWRSILRGFHFDPTEIPIVGWKQYIFWNVWGLTSGSKPNGGSAGITKFHFSMFQSWNLPKSYCMIPSLNSIDMYQDVIVPIGPHFWIWSFPILSHKSSHFPHAPVGFWPRSASPAPRWAEAVWLRLGKPAAGWVGDHDGNQLRLGLHIWHMRMVNSRVLGRFFSTKNGDFILDMISENGWTPGV